MTIQIDNNWTSVSIHVTRPLTTSPDGTTTQTLWLAREEWLELTNLIATNWLQSGPSVVVGEMRV
jgi:hypothetical protein